MLLSFSLPDMLPNLVLGLDEAGALAGKPTAPLFDWAAHVCGGGRTVWAHADATTGPKRQTIRAFNPATSSARSPYRRAAPGGTAHLWWKSRVPDEKRKLGVVRLQGVRRVAMQRYYVGPPKVVTLERGRWADVPNLDAFARADGFPDVEAMADWFVPEPGDSFQGVVLSW